MYLTEYYDTTKQEGYLEFTVDKVLTKVYYRHETEEIFVFDSKLSFFTVSLASNALTRVLSLSLIDGI